MMNLDVTYSNLLKRISFKLKYDKNLSIDKSNDYNKNVQLSFHDLDN
jgi:hypothetical protein